MTVHISQSTSKTSSALEALALTCVRGEKQLFTDLSFQVGLGECLHVRGENGVGKTSLLRLLTGLSKPESGDVLWNQQSISAEPKTYHRDLLFLGHRDALKEELSALENLKMYAAIDGVALADENAMLALRRFGLRGREHLPVHCLSAGQKRRVLMARLVTRPARIWILDEPFNALDSRAVSELEALIEERLTLGGIVILTSHQSVNLLNLKVLDL